jgi:hypothetical protein
MGDNYNGRDDHISQWFSMNPNQQQQQSQQMIQAPMVDVRNMFSVDPASSPAIDRPQHQQVEGVQLNHQNYYPPPQYAEQSQQSLPHPAEQPQLQLYQQTFHQQGLYHQQMPPQQYPQQQQQQHQQPYPDRQRHAKGLRSIDLTSDDSSGMNSTRGSDNSNPPSLLNNYSDTYPPRQQTSMEPPPMGVSHTQQSSIDKSLIRTPSVTSVIGASSDHSRSANPTAQNIAISRSKAHSERKRNREQQRREGVNRQFAELTNVLKRLELEEREEAERKLRLAAGSDGSMSASLHSVRLPFIAPNNSVDMIACTIVHLQHLHRMSKRQQYDLNRLEDEVQNAKKAGEDTATKLKEVLFNYQIPRPHLGMTNPSFNVGKTSSNRKVNDNNNNNSGNNNSNTNKMMAGTNGNNGSSTSMGMSAVMSGGSQQKQQVSTRNFRFYGVRHPNIRIDELFAY